MKIQALLHLLLEHPILYQLSWDKITEFIDIIRILKPDLCRLQASYQHGPPEHLPLNYHEFLQVSLEVTDNVAKLAWETLRLLAWDHDDRDNQATFQTMGDNNKYLKMFLIHGVFRGIGK
jgi:hypothetical protein